MNILMVYRNKCYNEELLPKLVEFAEHNITCLVSSNFEKNALKYYDRNTKRINKIKHIQELLDGKLDKMKFDYIIGNPPYQKKVKGDNKTQQIWSDLIVKFYDMLNDDGEMSMIHPGGWRFTSSRSVNNLKRIKEIYSTNKITYMELNDKLSGKKMFGANTDYDIVTMTKEIYNGDTNIKTLAGDYNINLRDYNVIPTNRFDLFEKLKAKNRDEKFEVLYSSSNYETRKEYMSIKQDENYKYPCVYTITEKKGVKFYYSNTKKYGHFGVSKLILKNGSTSTLLDIKGNYGLTQFAYGIIDTPENLIQIQKAMDTKEFKILKNYFCGIGLSAKNSQIDGLGHMVKFLREFKKDFWKDFINE